MITVRISKGLKNIFIKLDKNMLLKNTFYIYLKNYFKNCMLLQSTGILNPKISLKCYVKMGRKGKFDDQLHSITSFSFNQLNLPNNLKIPDQAYQSICRFINWVSSQKLYLPHRLSYHSKFTREH